MNFVKFIRIIGVVTLSMMLLASAWHSSTFAYAPLASPDEAPQAILTGFSPIGLVRNDTHLFVARGGFGLESCQFDPTQSAVVLQRVNFDGGGSVPLLSRCAFVLNGMVADNAYVYLRDSDDKLKRLPVGGGALEILVDDVSTCCGLAMDDTYLYWARRENGSSNNGIFRVLKTGGAIEQVASVTSSSNTYFIRDLALDATHVFWVEGKQGISAIDQPGVGAVGKVLKGGGALEMLADTGDGIENPLSIALDETHVYWSEWETARARRVAKNGGAVTSFTDAQPSRTGQFVAVNDSDVYWTDTDLSYAGRLRRAGKDGGAASDLAIAMLGPGKPLLTDSHVYWPQSGGVYRLPLGTGEVTVDFSIDAVEVTQVIQDLNNHVPLVAEKYAFVRVYPRVDLYTGQIPKVQLRGFRGGVELGGSPLSPISPNIIVFDNDVDRSRLDRTFNFKLPEPWRADAVTLQAEINYDGAINELNHANNNKSVAVNFVHKKPLCVEMVRVHTAPQTASTDDPGFHEIVDWLENAYPVPSVLLDEGGMIKEGRGPYELPDDTNKALARIGWYRLWHDHNQWQKCGAAHFYGMVHPSEMSAGGIGYRPGWSAWGVMATDAASQPIADAAPWYAPHGGATLAHEIGHNKDRKHVNCGGPDDTDGNYPYNPCDIGSGVPGAHMGYDYLDETVIGAAEAGDLMSYAMGVGKPRWPSDYTYNAIFNKIPDSALLAATANPLADALAQADYATEGSRLLAQNLLATENVLLVSALVTPTTTSALYDQLFVVPQGTIAESTLIDTAATTLVSDNGQYILRLLDAAEIVVGEMRFDLPDSDGPSGIGGEGRSFVVAMPFADQTARVVLLQNGAEIASRSASLNAPSVHVLEPNGGESYAGSLTIRWEAKDLDSDALTYLVQYSADKGDTWRVVETEAISTSLTITDVRHLPGTTGFTALVRVFANDGLRTAADVSDQPFSLRGQPPRTHISNPAEGELVALGETLTLLGDGFDAEDGRVAASGLHWVLDGLPIGAGREVDVNGLTLGKHTVKLMAVDSGDLHAFDEHTFFVQQQYCADNDNQLDLVFVIDNSAPMSTHAQNFCKALPGLLADLKDLGLEVRHEVFDVASAASGGVASACATTAVQTRWRTEIDHPADWGKAVGAVATGYPWQANATRLIVPVTNQGPEDGNPTADPGADRDTINQAMNTATAGAVAVAPLMMPPADSLNFFVNMQLAEEIADATGGTVMQWADPNLKLSASIQALQGQLGCTPTVGTVNPSSATGTQEVCLVGQHFWPGTTVFIGAQPVPATSVNADGALLCFNLPASVEQGKQPIRLERPGVQPNAGKSTIEINPQSNNVSFNLYLPLVKR